MESEPIIFQCDGCAAFKRNPDDEAVGECRRHAASPMVLHVTSPPELTEDGRLKGGRLTIWPGVLATDACVEFVPSNTTMAKAAESAEAIQAAMEAVGVTGKH